MKKDIKQIIAEGESQQTEFKSSFNTEAMESIVAFANTEGGRVLIGVSNKGKIVGVVTNDESVQQWVNEIKSKTEPAILVDAERNEIEGKTVVMLSVPEYPVKPIALQGRFFKRIGNSNHLLSATEIANLSMLSLQVSWDSFPALGKTLEDLDVESIERFIERVSSNGRLSLSGKTWADKLRKLKLINSETPTNAAYLLFGKGSIGYNVHAGRFKTPSLIIDDKMLNCNLFDAVEETMKFLLSQIKVAYEITGKTTQRTEIFEYPLPALREIVLNTIIHRDYTSPMDVQIKVFDQKITFFSPGELYGKQTIEALRTDDYQAYTRNKLIAEAFYLTGDIEKYGTGYTRIRKEIEDYPTMKFEFEEKPSAWLVTISYEKRKTEEKDELATEHATELATNLSQLVTDLSVQVKALIINLNKQHLSFEELKHATELATKHATISRQYFSKAYIRPAFNFGLIAMLFPDNQRHPKQKYYLTEKGKEILNALLTQKSLKENEEKPPKKPSKMKENEEKPSKKPSEMKENEEKPPKKPSEMKENGEKPSKKPSKMKENGKKPSKKPSELAKNDEKQSSEFPSPIAKKVYEAIKSNRKAKYTWLQDNLGVSESSILRAINELKRLGYINTNPSKLNGEWQLLK